MKILIVSSVGGHLTEVMALAPLLAGHEVVLVLNDDAPLPDFPFVRVYRIAHAERDIKVLTNLVEAARILIEEMPDVVLSTGAGPAVPLALLARWALGVAIVYVETAAAVCRPTLTGRLMYPISDHFFYQWPALRRWFPRGTCAAILFG